MHLSLGLAHRVRAELRAAAAHFDEAARIARDIGWPEAQASAASSMGVIHTELGEPRIGVTRIAEAVAIYRAVGRQASEAVALANLGTLHSAMGDLELANEASTQALALYRETGNVATALTAQLGSAPEDGSWTGPSAARQALERARSAAAREPEIAALTALAHALRVDGRADEAVSHATSAVALAREGGFALLEKKAREALRAIRR
ncbi:tetratricopeptide repeat protein [Asanoa ishikariensis]|nr:tetratricopeptide repeat protein [Asanoa ishikariensis]